jgi:malonyl-CoA/methylmalonyl-CoA synthetase
VERPVDPPPIARARRHGERVAVLAGGSRFRYADLLDASSRVAAGLLRGARDLDEARVAFLVPPGFDWVAVQWGIWRAGGIAVPLAPSHPRPELDHVIDDEEVASVVVHPSLRGTIGGRGERVVDTTRLLAAVEAALPEVDPSRRAMILYTSGTTGRPKGVVTTHDNLAAQVTSLVEAWGWRPDDRTLLVLPLHHVHGIVNVVACALWSGACCEMLPGFDAGVVWDRFAPRGTDLGSVPSAPGSFPSPPSVFMAVPTIYARLAAFWEAASAERRRAMSAGAGGLRLMVSGSAALPVRLFERWRSITGHALLERYGMTEIGMALSNPLVGERRPGCVGRPLPGVEVRLRDEDGNEPGAGQPGEIEVRGPGVFLGYWRRPEETRAAFRDGWFRTGDIARVDRGSYRILGRTGIDVIKTGGYKVSALEIEEVLREHPAVAECAVVGIDDPEWGERVAVAVEARPGATATLDDLRGWARSRLAPYKLPTALRVVHGLPRNSLGKVTKPEVALLFR